MDKSFENYNLEDFIADESFINYLFRADECDRIFWEEWIIDNPAKRSIVKEAAEIIRSLSLTLSEKEYQEEFEKLHIAIKKNKSSPVLHLLKWNQASRSQHRFKRTIQYLALCVLVLIAGEHIYLANNLEIKFQNRAQLLPVAIRLSLSL